jgi:hypothetical protein
MILAVAASLALVPPQAVLASKRFAKGGSPMVEADLLARPKGIDPGDFAARVVAAERLSSWNGTGARMPFGGGLEAIVVYGGDGRRAVVVYPPGPAEKAGRVCRLRVAARAARADWGTAGAWCSEQLKEK